MSDLWIDILHNICVSTEQNIRLEFDFKTDVRSN